MKSRLKQLEFMWYEELHISNELRAYCRRHYKKDYYLYKSIPGIGGIKSKQKSVAPSTLQVFKNLKRILLSFQTYRNKPITFDEIDIDFYEQFLNYLSFEHIHQNRKQIIKGFKTNTVGKNIKQLIIFLKNRKKKKIAPDLDTTDF